MDETQRRVDAVRRRSGEIDNHLIETYAAGRISRREFIRRGTVLGMSLPALSFLAAACGGDDEASTGTGATETQGAAQAGGVLRSATLPPATELNPLLVQDEGGLCVLGQSGEYLCFSDRDLQLRPVLAEGWEPNEDSSVWTFTIRQGVKYHDGTDLTTEDVAATIDKLADPDVGSNSLSVFTGVLS